MTEETKGPDAPDLPRQDRRDVLRMAAAAGAFGVAGGASTAARAQSGDGNEATPTFPRAFNHIGFNVADLDGAVTFYRDVLGGNVLIPPFEIVAGEGEPGERFAGLAGTSFGATRAAYVTMGNGVGLEIFQFTDPATPEPETASADSPMGDYARLGPWHFSFTDPDIDGLIARIEAAGGQRVSETVETPPGSGYRLAFVRDPFGILLEIMNVNFDQGLSNLL